MLITNMEEFLRHENTEDFVICAGWFDMFHIGHLNFIRNAKKEGSKLVVVVMNDEDGRTIKGETRPIINEEQRAEIIDNLKFVDYTIIANYSELGRKQREFEDIKTKILWNKYIPIIKKLNIKKVFSLEETLKFNGLGDYLESTGHTIIYSERTEGISTTDLENKLKNK
jgi:cytidyltransferase-like protein